MCDELLNETLFFGLVDARLAIQSWVADYNESPRIPLWTTRHRRLLPLTSTQPAMALRSSMAPRSRRLLNPRRKVYQQPRL